MRKLGVGVDLIKNSRIKAVLSKSYMRRFLTRVLHQDELNFFDNIKLNQSQVQYVASRWAVKEAVVKAVGIRQLVFNQLKIAKDQRGIKVYYLGKPYLQICSEGNKELLKKLNVYQIHISLTHQDQYSSAFALATFQQ